MGDAADAYAEVQSRMSGLAAGLSSSQLSRRVPACPEWTVQDLLAHHTGVTVDIVNGTATELGELARILNQHDDAAVASDRDAMTARQVAERRPRPIAGILDEWAAATATLLPMIRGEAPFPDNVGPLGGAIAINDVVVHEGDLREALELEAAPVVHATSLALAAYGFNLDARVRGLGLPAMAFEYDGKRRVFGDGEPAAVLSADRATLVRVIASRFTGDELRAMNWQGDPTPYLDVIGEYGPRQAS